MATRPIGPVARQVERIFGPGTATGLTDGELVERFARRRDEAAFEALVARHGPMVLGSEAGRPPDPSAYPRAEVVIVKNE
jgi:hypothetical protein